MDTPQKPKESAPPSSDIPSLRTYKADVQHVMQDGRTSLIKMVLEEQRAKMKRREETSPGTRKNAILIALSAVFLLASIALIYFVFIRHVLTEDEKTLQALDVRPMILVEKNREILADTSFEREVRKKISEHIANDKLSLDTIEYLFLTEEVSIETKEGIVKEKQILTPAKVFSFIDLRMPPILYRAIGVDYMFGIHYFNGNAPFLILTTEYYDNMFAGMLEWEKRIPEEVLSFFGDPAKGVELRNKRFEDLVVKNNDTRTLRDRNGDTALLYAFKDEKTLIITTSEDTLLEVSRRLDLARGRK